MKKVWMSHGLRFAEGGKKYSPKDVFLELLREISLQADLAVGEAHTMPWGRTGPFGAQDKHLAGKQAPSRICTGLGTSVLQRLTHMLSSLHMNVPTLIHGCKHMRVRGTRTSAPFFSRSHGSLPDCKRAGRTLSRLNGTASAAGRSVLRPAHRQKRDWSVQLIATRFSQQKCPH